MCAILYFLLIVCNKPHANPTIIYETIKEMYILAVRGILEFPILSHVLLRHVYVSEAWNSLSTLGCVLVFFHKTGISKEY